MKNIKINLIKAIILAVVFILFSCGRLFHYIFIKHTSPGPASQWAVFSGTWLTVMAYFIIDLFLARGLLQYKITACRILLVFLAAAAAGNYFLSRSVIHQPNLIFSITAILAGILYIFLLVADFRSGKKDDFLFDNNNRLPAGYQRPHPLRTLLETILRLFPNPLPVGLYEIGSPGSDAPLIVTGNYDLTVRRVVRALSGKNCRLLVCDSRGVNIWCSSLAGHFKTAAVLRAMQLSQYTADRFSGKIILPQLCAASVLPAEIKAVTGFSCTFGPVRISDLGRFLVNPRDRDIRLVSFNTGERAEMAIATIFLPALFLLFVFNFPGLQKLLLIIPVLYVLAAAHALIFPHRPVKNIFIWSLFCGIVTAGFCSPLFFLLLRSDMWLYTAAISLMMIYLINEFEAWSPLVKFSFSGAYRKAVIRIDKQLCTGCSRCITVCPRGVYTIQTEHKASVDNPAACCSCKSCLKQCPVNAIDHSARMIDESIPGV